jgi:hypothetical protein
MLERYVVKGWLGEAWPVRPKDSRFEGTFSLLRGGNFMVRDLGPRRVFVGFKPWIDLFEDDARSKHSPSPRVNVTLLEIK